jgi:hypothetical protein
LKNFESNFCLKTGLGLIDYLGKFFLYIKLMDCSDIGLSTIGISLITPEYHFSGVTQIAIERASRQARGKLSENSSM